VFRVFRQFHKVRSRKPSFRCSVFSETPDSPGPRGLPLLDRGAQLFSEALFALSDAYVTMAQCTGCRDHHSPGVTRCGTQLV